LRDPFSAPPHNPLTLSDGLNSTSGNSYLATPKVGIDLAIAMTHASGVGTITQRVDHTVTLGKHGYSDTLTVASTGYIYPVKYHANGVDIPRGIVGASLLNLGTIEGGYCGGTGVGGAAVRVSAAGATITNEGRLLGGDRFGSGLLSTAPGVILTNDGSIQAGYYGTAVEFQARGTIVNGGQISGGFGGGTAVDFTLSAMISNSGTITGGAGGGIGIDLRRGGNLTNTGTIQGGAYSDRTSQLALNGGIGLTVGAPAMIINNGLIFGGNADQIFYISGIGGIGVDLTLGGSLVNNGIIAGGTGGASENGLYGLGGVGVILAHGGEITNSGTILGGSGGSAYYANEHGGNGAAGVDLASGGTLVNFGVIIGGGGGSNAGHRHGGSSGPGVEANGGTIIDYGTISGISAFGTYGSAIAFGTNAGTLVLEPGAVFHGAVSGGPMDMLDLGGSTAGTLSGIGTTVTGFGTISEASGAIWTLGPTTTLGNGTILRDAGSLTFMGTLTNNGTIDVTTGSLSIDARAANNGIIEAASGVVTSLYGVAGTGTLQVGATGAFALQNGALAGQVVDFLASTGLVDLNHPLSFYGSIEGFRAGDKIDLTKPTGFQATGYNFSSGVLTIIDNGSTVAALHFLGNYTTADFALSSDGHGGLFLTNV
jgi:hypothetical protein